MDESVVALSNKVRAQVRGTLAEMPELEQAAFDLRVRKGSVDWRSVIRTEVEKVHAGGSGATST